ncbi:MAG: class I SAM-dependent methyltransferase [Alphaproteobacteria bacterium]
MDAFTAYVMVRRAQSVRIVEVGAGHSTQFLARAIRDGHLMTRLTSIDPQLQATLSGFDVLTKPLQDIPLSLFGSLGLGDILFVDSSHVLAPGSDVELLMGHILPPLPNGLLVHFHDILLPNDYPSDWAHRRYNEQSAVAGLLSRGDWQIKFSSAHAVRRKGEAIAQSVAGELRLSAGARESSL